MTEKFDTRLIDRAIASADLKDKAIPREVPRNSEQLQRAFEKARKIWRLFILSKNIERSKNKSFEIKFDPLLQTLELFYAPRKFALKAADDIVLETPGIIKTEDSYKLNDFEEFIKFRGQVKEARKQLIQKQRQEAATQRQLSKWLLEKEHPILTNLEAAKPEGKKTSKEPKKGPTEREKLRHLQKKMILDILKTGSRGLLELSWVIDADKRVVESMVMELAKNNKVKVVIRENTKDEDNPIAKIYRTFVELNKNEL